MKKRNWSAKILIMLLLPGLFFLPVCKKQAFMANDDAKITISAEKTAIGINESTVISILGYNADGSLLWDGSRVDLTVENGSLNMNTVELNDGRGQVTATGNKNPGEMKITARSGNAIAIPNPLNIDVGTPQTISRLLISLNPATLPYTGGRVEITVRVLDEALAPVPNILVALETSAGMLDSQGTPTYSNSAGMVTDFLQTTSDADITAYAGDKSKTASVSLEDAPEPNQPPTAAFAYSPTDPYSYEIIYFNGSLSSDADGVIAKYLWDFGDGTIKQGVKPTHFYDLQNLPDKTFAVTLTVTDDDGARHAVTREIYVSKKPSGRKTR